MSIEHRYQLAMAECHSLRRQLKDAYEKCTAIFDALSILDQSAQNERTILERMISDLRKTIEDELEKNLALSHEKFYYEEHEKHLQENLKIKNEEWTIMANKYRRIALDQQQEKFIRDHLITPMNQKTKKK